MKCSQIVPFDNILINALLYILQLFFIFNF